MSLSFWQKLKLAWRGWSRRQDEAAAKRKADFLGKELRWGNLPPQAPAPAPAAAASPQVDHEGLQVAYLDDSGQIEYYFDRDRGDVIERRLGESAPDARYRKVPRRSEASDAADRLAFAEGLDEPMRSSLLAADADVFRRLIANDRSVERAWYLFKNERATKAIEAWRMKNEG